MKALDGFPSGQTADAGLLGEDSLRRQRLVGRKHSPKDSVEEAFNQVID
ncbi:hypothetical protein RCH23_000130 [Cryobacterium sp. CAN_C3]|nr:hypothetical protein [Cryobacterium sp. CAN_C3]